MVLEAIHTEAFLHPAGGDVLHLVEAAIDAQLKASTPRSVYQLPAPKGMEARFIRSTGRYRDSGDDIELSMTGKSAYRTITTKVEVEQASSPMLNLSEEASASDVPESLVVREVHERRHVTLADGTEVDRAVTYSQDFYRARRSTPDFHPQTSETTTVLVPLESVPLVDGKEMTISFPWDGYDDDLVEEQPNAVVYTIHGQDKALSKTYVYRDSKGGVNYPRDSSSWTPTGKEYDVRDIFVNAPKEQEMIGGIMMRVNMGSVDESLKEMIGKVVPRKQK